MQTTSHYWQPRRLGHANLFIGDYERAADYYRDVAGFREVYRQPNNMATFVSNGNTYHDLGLTDLRSRYGKPGQRPGLWHLAFEVENEVDLVEGYKRDAHPKIEVWRAETGHPMIQPTDPLVRAVATDATLSLPVPVLDLNDTRAVADFVLREVGLV